MLNYSIGFHVLGLDGSQDDAMESHVIPTREKLGFPLARLDHRIVSGWFELLSPLQKAEELRLGDWMSPRGNSLNNGRKPLWIPIPISASARPHFVGSNNLPHLQFL